MEGRSRRLFAELHAGCFFREMPRQYPPRGRGSEFTNQLFEQLADTPASVLAGYAASLVVIWYVTTGFAAWYRLRHIPGPFLGSFSFAWDVYYSCTGRVERMATVHDDYANGGPLVRVAPNHVVTNDPEILRRIASARTRYTRDAWFKGTRFHREYDNVASIPGNEEHDRLKAKFASGYNGRENGADFEPAIDSQVDALTTLINRKYLSTADETKPAELSSLIRYFTLDTITRLAYGKPWGHLDEGTDVTGYCTFLYENMKYLNMFMEIPLLRNIMYSPYGLTMFGPRESDAAGAGRVMGIIHEIVTQRLQTDEKSRNWRDMLGGWVRSGLTQQEIEGEANLQILAGAETTATALSATLMHLSTTPHAYLRLKREIRDSIANGAVAADRPATFEQAQKLPYLNSVVWEGFRMCPPVNFGHYKSVPPGGDTINGVFLPGGTAIGHNSMAMTKTKAIFGRDVELFRPERLLEPECDAETRAYRINSLHMVFGGGRWTCSGKQVALYELHKAVFEIMRRFDLQVLDPKKAWKVAHYTTPTLSGMFIRITEADWSVV
ncbi:cytochrome P450 [Cercophora newfieldiana]|uniref:Cytochrome P450 n=1 Tax=Cercophora newfieldiana TaxID=92897 RepID=A0AA40CSK7_9PEZI|nr:cytochrome P450 [Cercophora newfieldiana]